MQFPDLNQLFTEFTQRESLLFLAFCLVSFLFGLLIGYVLRGRRVRELRRELKKKDAEISQRDEKIQQLTNDLSLRDADLKKVRYELDETSERAQRLEVERGKLNNQITYLKDELEKERAAQESQQTTIEDLNEQILGLRTKLAAGSNESTADTDTGNTNMSSRLAAVEDRVAQLEAENDQLEQTIATLSKPQGTTKQIIDTPEVRDVEEPDVVGEDGMDVLHIDRSRFQQAEKDDLTLIDGVGPFLEKKLNDAGVFTYDQISKWTPQDIQRVTKEIQFFKGRIEKDNWVSQARRLSSLKEDNPEALISSEKPKSAPEDEADNLQLIAGIGPKIEMLLHERGIRRFQDIAKSDPQDLHTILEEADPKLLVRDPETWPAQARLAANQQWDVLKDYQEQLK
jgi:predicted flap endonuclease-1-like 5' DNA nuclease